MARPLKPARRLPCPLAISFAALAIMATFWAPSSAGANDDYAAAMAQEHAGESPSASPAASASARRAVSGENVVYATITGFGDDGPYADRRGYDPIFQALTGFVSAQLNPEVPIHDLVRNAIVDKATSYSLAQAITAALFARERGAPGQHVRVSMLDAGLAFFWPDGMLKHSLIGDDVVNPMVPGERYQLMSTADGQIIVWAGTADQMRGSLRAVGRDDLADSPGQRGVAMIQDANALERSLAVANGLLNMSTADSYEQMVAAEVPAAPVLSHQDVLVDPQIQHNGCILEAEHHTYGRYRRIRPSARFSETVEPSTRGAALYAEHSDEILDELGTPRKERERLRALGALT